MIEIGEYMRDTSAVRRALAGAAGLTMVAALTSCSDDTPDAAPVAEELAAALASGDLAGVALSGADAGDATAQVEEMTAGMDEVARTVEVTSIAQTDDGSGREAELEVTWDLDDSDDDWSYSTVASLSLVEDAWQVEWDPSVVHPDLSAGDRLVLSSSQAERGEIHGAGGEVIVAERPVYRVGIDKTRIDAGEVEQAARELADVVDVDADGLAERAEAAGDKAFVEAITLREADAVPVLASVDEIEGAVAIDDTMALAPTREFARPILGTVGEATAEIIEESEGGISAGDVVGLSGLQQHYDEALRGESGLTVEIVPGEGEGEGEAADGDADGDGDGEDAEAGESEETEPAEPVVVYEREARAGSDVVTTLDLDLQMRAEEILADVEPASAIAVVQPSSGAILAAASGPGGEGYSTATLGQYAPGSTFKIVTSLALLRAGLSPESAVSCTPTTTVEGKSFKNYSDYPSGSVGDISLRSAIANSCNTALIDQRDTVTQAELAEAAAALGIGAGHDIGAPAFLGDVPAEAGGTEHAASMIGQGQVLASPLAMATMAASVAAGRTVAPDLVEDAGGADGEAAEDGGETPGEGGETAVAPEDGAAAAGSALSEDEAQTLRDLMRAVVEEGSATFLAGVPGDPVGAKTGTAEYGSDSPLRTHAWMVAMQGDLAVAVFVEDGESGSQTAGPLLEEFLAGD